MGKVVGIGGVFLKAQDPKALQAWYVEHLGVPVVHGTCMFEGPESLGTTVFSFFPAATKYFGDGPQQSMVNFRVDSLDEVLDRITAAGARVDPNRQDEGYGRFGWFWDPEGNRVELWEPAPEEAEEPQSEPGAVPAAGS